MRHFQAYNADTTTIAWESFFYCFGNGSGKYQPPGQVSIINIKDLIYLYLRHYQYMAFPDGCNIKKRYKIAVFGNLMTRDLSGYDL